MVCVLSLLVGCASYLNPFSTRTESSLMKLQLGMSKEEVIHEIGKPDSFRGAQRLSNGKIAEVFEYRLPDAYLYTQLTDYWLVFIDNKLYQWGRAGDWESRPDEIKEIRIR